MPNTPGNGLRLVADNGDECAPPRPARLAMDWLHADATRAFLTEAPPELLSLAADAATALAVGTDRERHEARVRLAARMIAVGRVQVQALEVSLAAALERRDEAGIIMLNRVLEGVSRRLERWLSEHRASCAAGHRAVTIAVSAAGDVNIAGER